jgi:hypothetical protein
MDCLSSKVTIVHEMAHAWDANQGRRPSGGLVGFTQGDPPLHAAPNEYWANLVGQWVYPASSRTPLTVRQQNYVKAKVLVPETQPTFEAAPKGPIRAQ